MITRVFRRTRTLVGANQYGPFVVPQDAAFALLSLDAPGGYTTWPRLEADLIYGWFDFSPDGGAAWIRGLYGFTMRGGSLPTDRERIIPATGDPFLLKRALIGRLPALGSQTTFGAVTAHRRAMVRLMLPHRTLDMTITLQFALR